MQKPRKSPQAPQKSRTSPKPESSLDTKTAKAIRKAKTTKTPKLDYLEVKDAKARRFLDSLAQPDPLRDELADENLIAMIKEDLGGQGVRLADIGNRRYLGNKFSMTDFIRSSIESRMAKIESVMDIFAGTGSVSRAFADKRLIVNDILYSNHLSNTAWFSPEGYRPRLVADFVAFMNSIQSSSPNYMRKNFGDTYFSKDDSSKIGEARELVEAAKKNSLIDFREFAILVTSIIYGMDRTANTVGHYDAYRRNGDYSKKLVFPLILPTVSNHPGNLCLNMDATRLAGEIECDLLYMDPPYNSRQYCDAYHLLENVARWEKPPVEGVARKMDRTGMKSDFNTRKAATAMRALVASAKAKCIALSYNNMAEKGNDRSNAKISDADIMEILGEKGEVEMFERSYKAFSTGKSNIPDNAERLFLCMVSKKEKVRPPFVASPVNYTGGKFRLLPQIAHLLQPSEVFVDVFCGGGNVGANISAQKIVMNDINPDLVRLMRFLSKTPWEMVEQSMEDVIKKYDLSDTMRKGYAAHGCDGAAGLAAFNKERYLRLKNAYNRLKESILAKGGDFCGWPCDGAALSRFVQMAPGETPQAAKHGKGAILQADDFDELSLLLYALVVFGFNNQIRFNKSGEFNLPVGKRDFNANMRKKLKYFNERMMGLDVAFTNLDFADIPLASLPKDTLLYCDPPYLITQATYNENGAWSDAHERRLLSFLDEVHASGRKFALSNVTQAKGRTNQLLVEWIEMTGHHVHDLKMSYANSNYQRSDDGAGSREVLVTNYEV